MAQYGKLVMVRLYFIFIFLQHVVCEGCVGKFFFSLSHPIFVKLSFFFPNEMTRSSHAFIEKKKILESKFLLGEGKSMKEFP